jgi:hypothetical protein
MAWRAHQHGTWEWPREQSAGKRNQARESKPLWAPKRKRSPWRGDVPGRNSSSNYGEPDDIGTSAGGHASSSAVTPDLSALQPGLEDIINKVRLNDAAQQELQSLAPDKQVELAAAGCCWLLLAAAGYCWLLLAAAGCC